MWRKLGKPYKFIAAFLGIAGLLLIFWKIIALLYLHLLVAIAKPIWSVFNSPVQLEIRDNILRFIYLQISPEPMSFSVNKSDEIYLNLILVVSLYSALWIIVKKKILYPFLVSLGILFVVHELILYLYSYTGIWEFADSLDYNSQKELLNNILNLFPKVKANLFNQLIFHWNAWGWDVVPLILWLGGAYKLILPEITKKKR